MKTAMYLRKSRADEMNPEDTLSKHKETLLDFAQKNQLEIVRIYEEVASGESIFARPEMLNLLRDLEEERYEAVLCMDIDRLGRGDMEEQGMIMNKFRSSNTKIITPREVYQPGDEKDEMFFEFKGIIARNELKAIKRRLHTGRMRTLQQGGFLSEPPYGYRRAWKDKIPTLEPVPEQAEVVKMVFQQYINGTGTCLIADHLNKLGLKNKDAKDFSSNTIRFMLQNKAYIGLVTWNRNKETDVKRDDGTNKRKITPENEWTTVQGIHPPIIEKAVFEQAEEIRKTRSHPSTSTGEVKNPFCSLMYCKNCNMPIGRFHGGKHGAERVGCRNTGCTKSALLSEVEKAVFQSILDYIRQCDYQPAPQQEKPVEEGILKRLQKQLEQALAKQKRLHYLLEEGVYDVPTFTERRTAVEQEIQHLNHEIEEQQTAIREREQQQHCELLPNAETFLQTYWDCSAREKNMILRTLIQKIYYQRDKGKHHNGFTLEFYFKFGPADGPVSKWTELPPNKKKKKETSSCKTT